MKRTRRTPLTAAALTAGVVVAGCGGEARPADDGSVVHIAAVDNADVQRMQELLETDGPDLGGVSVEWTLLEENELRQQVTMDVATGGGRFDLVMLGTYETPLWAQQEWLEPFDALGEDYQVDDLLPNVRENLSRDGTMYALPFYAESSFTMYRTDLFEAAGLEMPAEPTWEFILDAAEQLDGQDGAAGVCLRGKAGWGENIALLTVMANSQGGTWFDEDWRPTLETDAWRQAVQDYVTLAGYAPDGVDEAGYLENLTWFQQGECAIWVDATVAASAVTDPEVSEVADDVGFAMAPNAGGEVGSSWLWAWAFGVPETSTNPEAAQTIATWATGPDYAALVAEQDGWRNVPPGTRASLYQDPAYLEEAPFAEITLASLESADPENPTAAPVPYTGIQYVTIPEFQSTATAVGNLMTRAIRGEISVDEALSESQWVTDQVTERTRLINEQGADPGIDPTIVN